MITFIYKCLRYINYKTQIIKTNKSQTQKLKFQLELANMFFIGPSILKFVINPPKVNWRQLNMVFIVHNLLIFMYYVLWSALTVLMFAAVFHAVSFVK